MGAFKNKSNRYLMISVLFLAWFIGYFDRLAINIAIIPIGKEFSLTAAESGLILSVFFISYSTMQLFGGMFADKIGAKKVLIACVLAWSVFTGLTGFAVSLASLLVIRFLFGIGEGSFSPASSVAVAENFPRSGRARAKSILLSSYQLAGIVGSFGIASLLAMYNWRMAFHILAILGIAVSILLFFFLPATDKREKRKDEKKISFKQLIKIDLVWKVLIVWFGISIVDWGLASWMPSYLVNSRHLNLINMGLLAAVPTTCGFLSIIFSGWLLDKWMNGREKYFLIYGSLGTAFFLFLMFHAQTIPFAIIFWALCQISFCSVFVTIFAIPLKYLPGNSIGTATGTINFGGQVAGIIAPALIGFLVTMFHGSYHAAFWTLVIAALISALTGLTIKRRPPHPIDAMEINPAPEEI
ncbi:MAG: MFS transporter [Sporolactobacillus sp.]